MKKNFSLGLLIILIGVIWLLKNLDVFSFSIVGVFFRSLDKLWPLLLIGIGVTLLSKNNRPVKLITWLVILASIVIYGVTSSPVSFY